MLPEKLKINKAKAPKVLALFMIIITLIGIFVACGGLPALETEISSQTEKQTIQWKDPPEITIIKPTTPIPAKI